MTGIRVTIERVSIGTRDENNALVHDTVNHAVIPTHVDGPVVSTGNLTDNGIYALMAAIAIIMDGTISGATGVAILADL